MCAFLDHAQPRVASVKARQRSPPDLLGGARVVREDGAQKAKVYIGDRRVVVVCAENLLKPRGAPSS
jgi:hypothetical protein